MPLNKLNQTREKALKCAGYRDGSLVLKFTFVPARGRPKCASVF